MFYIFHGIWVFRFCGFGFSCCFFCFVLGLRLFVVSGFLIHVRKTANKKSQSEVQKCAKGGILEMQI